jgi:hypothetical protein
MKAKHVNQRVQKHRDALRESGLRLVQLWLPDTRRPDFTDECLRQCLLVSVADREDQEVQSMMESALLDLEGWAG